MDGTDLKILKYMQANATLPLSELSRRVGLSKTPCWNRIRKLEELGVIDKRVTVLNRNKLGLPIVVFLSINLVNTPPSVSIPRDSGVTSSRRTSFTSP